MRGGRTRFAMRLTGSVSSGLGRAHVFMAQEHYQEQFKSILGDTAWPGTLNIQVSGDDLASYVALRNISGVDTLDISDDIKNSASEIDLSKIKALRVRGFLREGRSFGGATAFHATIQSSEAELPCAILIPDLTRHVDVVEVISTEFLREALSISDDDTVSLNLS
jgi:riboflavin kinase